VDLITKAWWTYRENDPWYLQLYSWFNVVEGCLWLLLAGLVLRRYLRHRNSITEPFYSLAFVTFGLSDFCESHSLTSWLIVAKGINLGILLVLRRYVLRRFYPQQKTY
jgi:multisubunit Na+/H+ antiporter MnhE subunit